MVGLIVSGPADLAALRAIGLTEAGAGLAEKMHRTATDLWPKPAKRLSAPMDDLRTCWDEPVD